MRRPIVKRTFIALLMALVAGLTLMVIWLVQLDSDIQRRFAEKRFAPPVEFYSAPEIVKVGSTYPTHYFESLFARKAFTHRDFNQSLSAGDVSIWSSDDCRAFLGISNVSSASTELAAAAHVGLSGAPDGVSSSLSPATIEKCVVFVNRGHSVAQTSAPEHGQIIALTAQGLVIGTYDREEKRATEEASIEPELFAQYYGEKPVLRSVVTIAGGDVPPLCLNALLAIEDASFYEHHGFSVRGLARAVLKMIRGGRKEGGSTLTQQLVKNYFLTSEQTIKRKITELAMAILVEQHASKDDILETYINLIYMGQNGPFEVRGFAAAAEHYFGKPLRDLDLPECALIAGVLNGPGVYDPNRHPDAALKRRERVLDRMVELRYIDAAKANDAKARPIPKHIQRSLTEPAPYFVQAVRRDIAARGINDEDGLKIYTTLNLRAQEAAQQAVRAGLDHLESTYPWIAKIKASGKSLEAVLVSSNPQTGAIEALVGGRGFQATQFNRAIDSRRQVGSVMKPFVYLTAFEHQQPDGQPYSPLTTVADKATTHKFEGQTWTPKNYEGTYNGDVPLYFALKESLNAATVNLGMAVGLDNIIETARRMGVTSKIQPLPSLTLGAFELSPLEVLQAYGTFASFGRKVPLSLLWKVQDLNGKDLYTFNPVVEQAASSDSVAELVGVLKHTMLSGTARGARLGGFTAPAAGKTGTTNDKKDAWFAGFTPYHTAIVWVGYDDNTSHNLTGGSGAVPIWTQYMKSFASSFPNQDFAWPEGTERMIFTPEQLMGFGVPDEQFKDKRAPPIPVELVFREGLAPKIAH